MTSPAILRQTMKLLGYTNQSMADELSGVRMDNQKTSPATISRWVSGSQAIEPALLLYLKERLAHKLHAEFKPKLSGPKVIGIGGGKGGSGSSCIAHALSVGATNLGYRVGLHTYSQHCNNSYLLSGETHKFRMSGPDTEIDPSGLDFVFVDVPSRFFSEHRNLDEVHRLLHACDFVLIPVDLNGGFGVRPAEMVFEFLDTLADCPPWRALQCSGSFDFERVFSSLLKLEAAKERLLPAPLIYKVEPVEYSHSFRAWEFASEHAEITFYELLEAICECLGLSLHERLPEYSTLRRMPLEDLVAYFGD